MINTKYLSNVTFYAVSPWSKIIPNITYAVRCSYHNTLQDTPGKLVFGRYMIPDTNFQQNYKEMSLRKQKLINNYNYRENENQVQYDYEVSHYVYIQREGFYRELEREKLGPFIITQVHTNGSVSGAVSPTDRRPLMKSL